MTTHERPYYYKVTLQPAEFKRLLAQIPDMPDKALREVTGNWWKGEHISADTRKASVFLRGFLTDDRLVNIFNAVSEAKIAPATGPIPGTKKPKWVLVAMSDAALDASTVTARILGQKPSIVRANILRHTIRALFGFMEPDEAIAPHLR